MMLVMMTMMMIMATITNHCNRSEDEFGDEGDEDGCRW